MPIRSAPRGIDWRTASHADRPHRLRSFARCAGSRPLRKAPDEPVAEDPHALLLAVLRGVEMATIVLLGEELVVIVLQRAELAAASESVGGPADRDLYPVCADRRANRFGSTLPPATSHPTPTPRPGRLAPDPSCRLVRCWLP